SYPLLLAVWKLVAVVAVFVAVRRCGRSMLGGSGRTVAVALVIALFMVSPSWLILNDLGVSLPGRPPDFGLLAGETFAVDWMVGSFPIALAVAASIAFVMHVPRLL